MNAIVWFILKYYYSICLGRIKKTTKPIIVAGFQAEI